jgi:cytochrome P450
MPRSVLADVKLPSGAVVAKGTIVVPSHDAANRDPAVFTEPEQVNFGRSPNPHLSYGYGAHHCIGAHLGGMEIRTAISVLTQELPMLRLAVPATQVKWKTGHSVTSPEALPVRWSIGLVDQSGPRT